MTLNQLKIGQTAIILSINSEKRLAYRLYDLGLLPDTKITVTGKAPFGDPIEVFLRGYSLSLRLSHAKQIQIKEDSLC